MAYVSNKLNNIFKDNIATLFNDIGRTVYVYNRASGTDCEWCIYDNKTGRSSGIAQSGKVWSTHPNYVSDLICPNCNGVGKLETTTITEVPEVIIEDIGGFQTERGQAFLFPRGSKRIIGKLSYILKDQSDLNSEDIFQEAVKIIIDGSIHRLIELNRLGIKDLYIFDAIVQRTNIIS